MNYFQKIGRVKRQRGCSLEKFYGRKKPDPTGVWTTDLQAGSLTAKQLSRNAFAFLSLTIAVANKLYFRKSDSKMEN